MIREFIRESKETSKLYNDVNNRLQKAKKDKDQKTLDSIYRDIDRLIKLNKNKIVL